MVGGGSGCGRVSFIENKKLKTSKFQSVEISMSRSQSLKVPKITKLIQWFREDIEPVGLDVHSMFSGRCWSRMQDIQKQIRRIFGICWSVPSSSKILRLRKIIFQRK